MFPLIGLSHYLHKFHQLWIFISAFSQFPRQFCSHPAGMGAVVLTDEQRKVDLQRKLTTSWPGRVEESLWDSGFAPLNTFLPCPNECVHSIIAEVQSSILHPVMSVWMSECRITQQVWGVCKALWVAKDDSKAPNKVQLACRHQWNECVLLGFG